MMEENMTEKTVKTVDQATLRNANRYFFSGEAVSMLEENAENATILSQIYHDSNQDVLDDMNRLFVSGLFDSLADADNETRSAVIQDITARSDVDYMFILSTDGTIVASAEEEMNGRNPAVASIMTQENLN